MQVKVKIETEYMIMVPDDFTREEINRQVEDIDNAIVLRHEVKDWHWEIQTP